MKKRGRKKKALEGRVYQRRSRCTDKLLPTWHLEYRVPGEPKPRRESAETTDYEAACAMLADKVAKAKSGKAPAPSRRTLGVETLLDGVLAHYKLKQHRSLETVKAHVATWKATAIGTARARDVTTAAVQHILVAWRAAGTTAATCNRRLGILRRAYRLGKVQLDPEVLDFSDLMLDEQSPRGRYLDAAAFAAISAKLPECYRAFFAFAYHTGVRKQQLARTTVAHIRTEPDGGLVIEWPAEEVKAKEPHTLWLDGRPLEIVRQLLEERRAAGRLYCAHLFHGPRCAPGHAPSTRYGCTGDFKKAWASACKAAGFPVGRKHGGFTFHNTRHTAVSNLVSAGVPAIEAMEVSGHRTPSVFKRYKIGTEQQVRRALRAVSAFTEAQQREADTRVVPLARPTGTTPR